MKYRLAILEPDRTSGSDTLISYESENAPFMSIHAGDLIHPGGWEIYAFTPGVSPILRVKSVEHQINQAQDGVITQSIWVYTEEVPDAKETRFS
jgi:hypothetical protein